MKFEFDGTKIVRAQPSLRELIWLLLIRLPLPFWAKRRLIAKLVTSVVIAGLKAYFEGKTKQPVTGAQLKHLEKCLGVNVKDAGE